MFHERSQKEGWGNLRKKVRGTLPVYSIMFEKLTLL